MQQKAILRLLILSPLFIFSTSLLAFVSGPDTCIVNDECENAFWIPGIFSHGPTFCLPGCNLNASPDPSLTNCEMDIYPTVWYYFDSDEKASGLNIEIISAEIEMPVFSVFSTLSDCQSLTQVELPGGGSGTCIVGSNGLAKAIGIPINGYTTYYIAVSSLHDVGGTFDLCVSTETDGFNCVIERNIEIVSRSNGGPLEGPFDPVETVSFCLNVEAFTAAENGCQWFQGLVPIFGNGWDPSSFTAEGQPLNSSVNTNPIGEVSNGLYGTSTWDWFTDVDYHHDRDDLNIGDHDNNGTLDMCNSTHEVDCPEAGIQGGCCNPCWGTPLGTTLPGGWFSYGINGSCNEPAPPIRVDWGDGNSCGGPMGPWSFCFNLTTRDIPDCMIDSTRKDLSIGFYTFADGEVGAWTGDESICALDFPIKLSLQAKCGRITTLPLVQLPTMCSGDTFNYLVHEPGVSFWEWNLSPYDAIPYETNQGFNGFTTDAPLLNDTDHPVEIKGVFIGTLDNGTNDKIIKRITFQLDNAETCGTTSTAGPEESLKKIRVYPVPANDLVNIQWDFDLQHTSTISMYNAHGVLTKQIPVSVADGHQIQITTDDLPSGIYWIILHNADFRQVVRMVKI